MSRRLTIFIDDQPVAAKPGQTVLEAAEGAGIYIPRLCHLAGVSPIGSCRICTVRINGRPQAACVQPVEAGMVIENDTEELRRARRELLELLLVEGNHYCMFCERSGGCQLQALAYRLGVTCTRHRYRYPAREVDASHRELLIDRNRCILCGRCVRAARELDGKATFGFVGRGASRTVVVNSRDGLAGTDVVAADHAVEACPVGAILVRGGAYTIPVGRRPYDHAPIGSEIEPAVVTPEEERRS